LGTGGFLLGFKFYSIKIWAKISEVSKRQFASLGQNIMGGMLMIMCSTIVSQHPCFIGNPQFIGVASLALIIFSIIAYSLHIKNGLYTSRLVGLYNRKK
jgi:hypothetical protein